MLSVRIVFLLLASLLLSGVPGCHQQPPPDPSHTRVSAIEKSVYPFYEFLPVPPNIGIVQYKVCTATFVAPNIAVSVQPVGLRLETYDVFLRDGDRAFSVDGLRVFRKEDPAAFVAISTSQPGRPLALRMTPFRVKERLTYVGFAPASSGYNARIDEAVWDLADAEVQDDPYLGGPANGFSVRAYPQHPSCGAVLIDRDGLLAGIIYASEGDLFLALNGSVMRYAQVAF